jgi:hypothetical protein
MSAKLTVAQKRFILAAMKTHGVIIFPGNNYSAYQQKKIIDRMTAAGLVVPGTEQITSQAWRAADPAGFDAIHFEAKEQFVLASGPIGPGTLLRHKGNGDVMRVTSTVLRSGHPYGNTLVFNAIYVEAEGWGADRRADRARYENESLSVRADHEGQLVQFPLWQYEIVPGHVRNNCPALPFGGCMNCTAPATVRAAQGDDSAYRPERTRADEPYPVGDRRWVHGRAILDNVERDRHVGAFSSMSDAAFEQLLELLAPKLLGSYTAVTMWLAERHARAVAEAIRHSDL